MSLEEQDVEELVENTEIDEEIVEEAEVQEKVVETEAETEAESDEMIVTIGDEESPPSETKEEAPEWVRDLRKAHREEKKRARELEKKLAEYEEAKKPQLGPKPTLESCEYDTEKFEKSLESWYDRKKSHDAELSQKENAEKQIQQEWQSRLESYEEAKGSLKVKDYAETEELVQDAFNTTQQGMIVSGAENPALLVYALGKNPRKLDELSQITDPVKFAFAVARMETQLKVTSRKPAAAPEKKISGSASASGSDARLNELRNEAAKTGDFSKVMAYKRQLKNK